MAKISSKGLEESLKKSSSKDAGRLKGSYRVLEEQRQDWVSVLEVIPRTEDQ